MSALISEISSASAEQSRQLRQHIARFQLADGSGLATDYQWEPPARLQAPEAPTWQ
ncbi:MULTISPECIES: hypothetical protein [Halomonadaceae]|uniref:hypothetical protein n=1 Tax=Halomonadaceae TaxID=28256 RepID=UPI001599E9B0|nr:MULTISPECIES: hypothetical protein [Halomonas]QJQ96565.1 hypothetical protein HIO72_15675 [Halomonas sp. PA5]